MFENLNCLIGLINSDNLVIFQCPNSNGDLTAISAIIDKTQKVENF